MSPGEYRLFGPLDRQLLATPQHWRLVSSIFPPDLPPLDDTAHARWLSRHEDFHPAREILFVLGGRSIGSLQHRFYEFVPGTLLLLDHGEEHDREYPPGSDGLTHLWIFLLQDRILARLLYVRNGGIEYARKTLLPDNRCWLEIVNTVWSQVRNSSLPDNLRRQKLLSVFSLLFLQFLEVDANESTIPPDSQPDFSPSQKMMRLIQEHIRNTSGNGVTIDKLARIAGYSKFHFFRLFREYSGCTVHEYINRVRREKAGEMREDGYRLKEIAATLGFSGPSALLHWLKQTEK